MSFDPSARRPHRILRLAATVTLTTAFLGCSTPSSPTANSAAACPGWTTSEYAAGRPIRKLRVFTNPATGDSAIEETVMAPKATPLFKTGKILNQYDFGPSSKTQIVYGPADLELPMHPAPGREAFLILQGSALLRLADGTERALVPGDMTIYEDTDASRGHGGRTGPCGYVALNLVP